jgi:hypothetical protein
MSGTDIEFNVKCPSRPALGDFKLLVPTSATVGEVKRRLSQNYPGNPEPATITVRVLPCVISRSPPQCWVTARETGRRGSVVRPDC